MCQPVSLDSVISPLTASPGHHRRCRYRTGEGIPCPFRLRTGCGSDTLLLKRPRFLRHRAAVTHFSTPRSSTSARLAILGDDDGTVAEQLAPTRRDGQLHSDVRSMSSKPLSYDHRVGDAADAGRFLTTVEDTLEH